MTYSWEAESREPTPGVKSLSQELGASAQSSVLQGMGLMVLGLAICISLQAITFSAWSFLSQRKGDPKDQMA